MSEIESVSAGIRWEAAARRDLRWTEVGVTSALAALLLALIVVGQVGLPAPLAALRLLLTLWFVLFAPGYALQAALFPPGGRSLRLRSTGRGDNAASQDGDDALAPDRPDLVERLALSFTLSLVIDAGIALLLDRLPWGIRLWPIVIAEALVIGAATAVAWYRRAPGLAPPVWPARAFDFARWWHGRERRDRVLYAILALAVLLMVVAAGSILLTKRADEQVAEFYLLGRDGRADNYPYQATVGRPITVTVGIANHEAVAAAFRAEVRSNTRVLATLNGIKLQGEETRAIPVQFAPVQAGADVPIAFLLYHEGSDTPYRSLRLWLTVQAAP